MSLLLLLPYIIKPVSEFITKRTIVDSTIAFRSVGNDVQTHDWGLYYCGILTNPCSEHQVTIAFSKVILHHQIFHAEMPLGRNSVQNSA